MTSSELGENSKVALDQSMLEVLRAIWRGVFLER